MIPYFITLNSYIQNGIQGESEGLVPPKIEHLSFWLQPSFYQAFYFAFVLIIIYVLISLFCFLF